MHAARCCIDKGWVAVKLQPPSKVVVNAVYRSSRQMCRGHHALSKTQLGEVILSPHSILCANLHNSTLVAHETNQVPAAEKPDQTFLTSDEVRHPSSVVPTYVQLYCNDMSQRHVDFDQRQLLGIIDVVGIRHIYASCSGICARDVVVHTILDVFKILPWEPFLAMVERSYLEDCVRRLIELPTYNEMCSMQSTRHCSAAGPVWVRGCPALWHSCQQSIWIDQID
jgi:hypothetical protein